MRRFLFDNRIVDLDTVEQLIEASSAAFRQHGYGLWKLTSKTGGEFCGVCGLSKSALIELDLLFSIAPPAWGQGFATESAGRVLQYAFAELGLPRVTATVDEPNRLSIKVLEKLGLGLQEAQVVNSNIVLLYAITLDEYLARQADQPLCSSPISVS